MSAPLSTAQRVAAWDAALSAVRAVLRDDGLREVVTPARLAEVALEPWIEPIRAERGLLATSPELPMKRLSCRGAPAMFQIAAVSRAGERGTRHREDFWLVEWYRPAGDLAVLQRDVQRIVDVACSAVARVLPADRAPPQPPRSWSAHALLDLVAHTCGAALTGDEDADALADALARVSPALVPPLLPPDHDPSVRALAAWTAFFSSWSDAALDPWLASQPGGVHVHGFPIALAALAEVAVDPGGRALALRVESHVRGVELANGYVELRDAGEQARRFAAVAALRAIHGAPVLPWPATFLAELADPGLPPLVGCALGLDRLVALACGAASIDDVALLPDAWG